MEGETAYTAWDLILGAGLVVQIVMLLLVLASVVSWVIIYVKSRQMVATARAEAAFSGLYHQARDLDQLVANVNRQDAAAASGSASVLRSGYRQFQRLRDEGLPLPDLREAGRRAMRVAMSEEVDRLDSSLAILAVISSSAPFVGLFGTVWGIMNSFQNIGATGQATLAVVAPGIAEALIATAFGLAAAIPSVIGYNMLTRRVEHHQTRLENFMDDLTGVLERQVRS
ncbi:protein TolQ [Thiohalorhabdus methylotrophus]|uniref:Protein TolQ n=1 Tax=Thiohalorhabdus methylotrophus TaxID=3242694 RepID=A0ABV4TR81_9GAMM